MAKKKKVNRKTVKKKIERTKVSIEDLFHSVNAMTEMIEALNRKIETLLISLGDDSESKNETSPDGTTLSDFEDNW